MSSKTTETASSRPTWRHPEREHIEKRMAILDAERESLMARRDASAERAASLGDRFFEIGRVEPKEYVEIARLQREQHEVQQQQAELGNRLGLLDTEKGSLMQRLRDIEEIEARGRGIAR